MKKTKKVLLTIFLAITIVNSMTGVAQAYLLNASDLLGQVDTVGNPVYNRQTRDNPYNTVISGAVLNGLEDLEIDTVNHRLFGADRNNNRVLVFNLDSNNQLNHWAADYVLGQPDFSTVSAGTTQSKFNTARYLAYDSNHQRLFVSEENNQRVTVFDLSEGITNGMNASYVLGQPDFTSNSVTTSEYGFKYPYGVEYDSANDYLYVVDGNNYRVLVFDVATIINGEPAIKVLGQPNFTSGSIGNPATSSNLNMPHGLTIDSVNQILYVTDTDHHRIMVFDVATIVNGESAINVLGQPDFTSSSASTSAVGMNQPYNVAFDSVDHRLFVADNTNHRVTVFNISDGVTNGEEAIKVLGQIDFNTASSGVTQSKFNKPRGMAYNSSTKQLYVGDSGNNRIMIFDLSAGITNGQNASGLLGHTTRGGVPNWTFTTANQMGAAIDDTGLYAPDDILLDPVGHRLFQSDQNNSRVLVYNLDSNNNLIDHFADVVIGRSDFFTGGVDNTGGGQAAFKWQHNLALDSARQHLFVADSYNNRIMVFDVANIVNGESAINVLGQPDFTTYDATTTAAGVNGPRGLAFDSTNNRLFVADRNNNRILVYNVAEISDGESAINVLGQPDFTSSSATTTANGLSSPYELDLDVEHQRLFVADKDNNRVVVYDVTEIANGEPAVNVLGQTDLTANIDKTGGPLSQDVLLKPRGVAYDSINNWLFVVEYTGHRVMIFDVNSITNGEPAINVLGQGNFTAGYLDEVGGINPGAAQNNLWFPETVEVDEANRKIYVSDQDNNRTMIFQLPKITTASLPNGTVGSAYNQTISVTGGTSPYTCALQSGTLPTGLTLNANCTITGTPSASGTSSFVVKAIDSSVTDESVGGLWHNKQFSITVNPAVQSLQITTTTLPNGTVGSAYNQTISVTGGTSPYTCALQSGTLPTGLSLNANCTITGAPSAAGTSNFTVRATDAAAATDDQLLSLTIVAGGGEEPEELTVTNVTVTPTAIEITFSADVVTLGLSSSDELGPATNSAADLRNYVFKTGNPLVARKLSRYDPYNMTTEYDGENKVMRIYGLESLNLSVGQAWQLQISANAIKHSSQNIYVTAYQGTGTVSTSTDPVINYISSNKSTSSCYSYPCSTSSGEQVIISGANFTATTIVVWNNEVEQTAGDFVSRTATQIITTVPTSLHNRGLVDVYLKDSVNNRISQRRDFVAGGLNYGIVIGRLTLSDGSTGVNKVKVRVEQPYFWGSGGEARTHNNGKYAVSINSAGTYEARFTTPANATEAAPLKVSNLSVTLGSVTDAGTKKFKTATVSGYVKTPLADGAVGVEGARVKVYKYDWTVEQTAITGADGSWKIYFDNTGSNPIYLGIQAEPEMYHQFINNYKPSIQGAYDQTLNKNQTISGVNLYLTKINVTGTIKTPIGTSSESNPHPNEAVPYVSVQLHDQNWTYQQWTQTDENGVFQFGGVPNGSNYILEIESPWSGDYSTYARTKIEGLIVGSNALGYNAATGITNLDSDAKAVSSALRFSLPNTWGRVVAGGSAVADAWLNFSKDNAWYSTNTKQDGKFKLNLPKGHYRMEVNPPANSAYSRYQTEIDITSATANNLGDITLSAPNVTGYIYGPTGVEGQQNVWVDLCPYNAPGNCYGDNTDADGYFAIGGVPDGSWQLQIHVDSWNSLYTAPASKILIIAAGAPTTLDSVAVSGNLIIRLTDPSQGGLKGKVCAPNDTNNCEHPQANVGLNLRPQNATTGFRWAQTDQNGNFAFGDISVGVYDLEVDPWDSQEYSRKLYTITINSNNSVAIGNSSFADRTIRLFLSSPTITGHLYTPVFASGHTEFNNPTPNEPIQWAWINLHQEGPMTGSGGWYGASTNQEGYFKFGGVKPGSNYVLEAEAGWGSVYSRKRYSGLTFTDTNNDNSADECSYNGNDDGNPTNGICDLDSLLGTATGLDNPIKAIRVDIPNLRGQIVNPDGAGVQNCWVMVHDQNWINQAGGNTDQNGYFNLGGLSDGTYQIEINMPWGGEQSYTSPDGLTVVISNSIATIKQNNVALANNKITLSTPKKILTGYVYKDTNSNNVYDSGVDTPVANAKVNANRDMGGGFFETRTDANGKYVLKISSGAWWVNIWPDWGNVVADWVYNEPPIRVSFASTSAKECKGTSVNCAAVDAAATVVGSGQDFKVESANATLSGYVKLQDGTAVANAWVDAHRGMGPGNGQQTDSNGRFSLKVPAGTYEIMVMPNTADYGSPDPITAKVAANQTTDVGTLYLKSRNSHIKGSITDNAGNAIGNVMVNAWQINGPGWANAFSNSNTGAYDLTVSEGTWGVMIMPMSAQYVYQGAPLNVTVTEGKTSTGNDFVLKIADTTLKISVVDKNEERVTDFWGGVWVKDMSLDDMLDFGGAMEDMMEKGGMIQGSEGEGGGSVGAATGSMGGGMEKGGFQGGGLVNGYTEIKVPGGSNAEPAQYEIGLHSPPGSQYTISSTKTVDVVSGVDQEVKIKVKLNDASIEGHLYVDANSDGDYDSGEEVSGVRAFVHANRSDGGWQMTESESDGSYRLTLCAGTWQINAWIDPFMTFGSDKYMVINEKASTNVGSGGTETRNIKLKKLDATISGTVIDPDGEPMDNVWVFVDYGTSEMISEFKGPGPGVGALTDSNGEYTLNVAAGTYKIGAGIPPWDTRNLISPDMLEVTVAQAGSVTGKNLQFKQADATISGEITLGDEKQAAFVRAWSDNGGATGVASTDGTYTLNVSSGDIWHVSAVTKLGTVFYQSDEKRVTTVAGNNTQNLALKQKNLVVPESKTASFSSSDSKSIILNNGLKVEAPAGSLASSGTVTLTITPKTDAQPDSKDKPLGLAYDFVAKDANGAQITSFVNDVSITIPYDEDLIKELGYSEDDLRPKYYDETTGTWENWKSVSQDKTNNTFTITTDHFTPGGLTGGRITVATTSDTGGDTGGGATSGAAAGLPIHGPTNISVWMNWGAEKTVSRTVTLSLSADNATEMLVSNSIDFAGAKWEEYKTLKYWTLTSGNGEKIVYVKFRDADYNESSVVSDTIVLQEEVAKISNGDLVKIADQPAVYLLLNNKRHVFPHLAVYQSWAYPEDFSTVKVVSSADLADFPQGDPVPFRDGSMFRGTTKSLYGKSSSAVFYVENGKLRPIKSSEIYQALFKDPKWSLVTWVPDDLLSKFNYTLGEIIAEANVHPNGSLVKYRDSAAVYLIENGKKRPFISWDALVSNGYAKKKIFVIPAAETYETAETISNLAESLTTPIIAAMYH